MIPSRVVLMGVLCIASAASARSGYYLFPALHDHTIVFEAEGDLWSVADSGGTAHRLTTSSGGEAFPRFSPDGTWIAFTGEYDGNPDVYVIPADGGEPRRLTWHPEVDQVIDWTPDGKSILYRSRAANQTTSGFEWHLFTVPVGGGEPTMLPIGWAARLAIGHNGLWAFNRSSVETRTWKRYRGGTSPGIWVGDPNRRDFKEVTKFAGPSAFPMWVGARIFFLSDQGGTGNLWSMNADGSDAKRETKFGDYDVRWPSVASDGRIVFSMAGDLYVFGAGGAKKVAIDLPTERLRARTRYSDAARDLSSFDLSADGDRLAIGTRGEVFSVAVKDGVTLPVTRGSAARERGASYSADGKTLAYISDASGEEDIRVIDAWGRGKPRVVVADGGWHFPPALSPDGKWLAYGNHEQKLYVVSAAGGAPKLVDHSTQAEIREYAWSPDGRYLAYTFALPTDFPQIKLYDVQTGKTVAVTGGTTIDYSPAWDPEGRYLYFLSDRAANPVPDGRDEENVEIRPTRPYLVVLAKDGKNPFANTNGLPGAAAPPPAKPDDKKKKLTVKLDLDGLASRFVAFPVPLGTYGALGASAKSVFYLQVKLPGMAEMPDSIGPASLEGTLVAFDLEKKKPKPFLDDIIGYKLNGSGDKIAIRKKDGLIVLDTSHPPAPEELGDAKVALDGVVVEVAPDAEWKQIFDESWRMMRDFYWDANMGGVDWKTEKARYAQLLPRIATRGELNDLLGELIGELATSHTYIFGGDYGSGPPHVSTGLLGADVTRVGNAFRIDHIYRGDPADGVRSPLDEPGVGVPVGAFITAVEHQPVAANQPLLAAFANLAEKDVVLTVATSADGKGARDVVVKLLGSESRLHYVDWVRRNREYVAKKTGGKVAYLHLPDMGAAGLIAFDTWFYPQIDKQALVLDVRWNGGGFISQRILERMRRRVIALFRSRWGATATYPTRSIDGPFVVLTNEYAGSDGDIFPTAVQLDKLAPVIGKRSWGGVIGIRADKPLVDGGIPTQPEFAFWDPVHGWATENRGVIPDIEVTDLPQDVARGVDAQLDRGISEVQTLMTTKKPLDRHYAPIPDRSRKAFAKELKE